MLVLSLLDYEPMSGYDIKQMLEMTDAERWGGVLIGSIYHALKKMESEGYVEVASIEQTGHRQKAIYSITDKGRSYLKQLTMDALQTPSITYPSTLYSALSYVDKLPKAEAVEALQSQAASLQREFETLKAGHKAKQEAMNGSLPAMSELIFDHMFKTVHQQLEFVDKAIQLLDG